MPSLNPVSGFVDVEGGKLYYEVAGEGHPLVLIHASVGNRTMWDGHFEELAKKYRVIRYDTRSYGKTTTEAVSYSNRQDLLDLLDHLGVDKAYLIGVSRGGQIAIDFTLEHPERVDALIPVAAGLSGYDLESNDLVPAHEWEAFNRMEELYEKGEFVKFAEMEAYHCVDGPGQPKGRADSGVLERVLAMNTENFTREEAKPTARPLDPPAAGRLGEIKVPTLIFAGDLDETISTLMADALEAGIPGARKVVFHDTAHMLNMEKPEEFNRTVLEFLEGV
jgi:3-oxoadipate enol-lactonase